MVYEIASSAAANAEQLFSPDRRFFYWNDKKFRNLRIEEFSFFVNKTGRYVLFAALDKTNIPISNPTENSSNFVDEGATYNVSGKYPSFVRFRILDRVENLAGLQWLTLGSGEATYFLREDSHQDDNVRHNNIKRVNQLLEVFSNQHLGAHRLLNDCLEALNDRTTPSSPHSTEHPTGASNMLIDVIKFIESRGFHFAPWQIACYVTALRTKPFVILAGVSGTGKSKLPALVAEATGAVSRLIPVRPDWTDSSDVIGYKNLQEKFQPGQLLQFIDEAQRLEEIQHVSIIDEMNLARVEHYFAEVLSRIEDREKVTLGYQSKPFYAGELNPEDRRWLDYGITPNLAIVGTVNMDESSHGFSKKVLDRAFTIELSDVDLDLRPTAPANEPPQQWPLEKWVPRAIRLGELANQTVEDEQHIQKVISTLKQINAILIQAQLQVGYRTRDEIALFVLHAQEHLEFFITEQDNAVDPLDLALLMKILPRIAGGSSPIRSTVLGLLGWSFNGQKLESEQDAEPLLTAWKTSGMAGSLPNARFPRTAARLCLMLDRLKSDGFTSFWL